jgi:hypothetical protein
MENRLLGIKRERSSEGISTQDVLSVLKLDDLGIATKGYLTNDNIEFGSYFVLNLCDGSQLVKDGDVHVVTTRKGNDAFVIRKLDDKKLDVREARMLSYGSFKEYLKLSHNFDNIAYVDIDVNEFGCKVGIKPIRMRSKYSTNELAGKFYQFMKMNERDDSDDDSEMAA